MKKLFTRKAANSTNPIMIIRVIMAIMVVMVIMVGCRGKGDPGRAYMPDMAYSNAYETYTDAESRLKNSGAESTPVYNFKPVAGTVARGDMAAYPFANDSAGYISSAGVKNPLNTGSVDLVEANRIYQINCGICHGARMDGMGPLYNDGNGPYTAAPKNLLADDMKNLADGTMFHSITYGKGQMGSYASQLSSKQRWEIITFIRSVQMGKAKPGVDSTAAAKPTDSTAVANTN